MPKRRNDLSPLEARFIDEYLIDLNGTKAVVRAGYKGKRTAEEAYRILRRPHVSKALAERQQALQIKTGITQERVLREMAAIAFHDVRKLFREDGTPKAFHELDDDTAAAFAGIEIEELFEHVGTGDERRKEHVGRIHKIKRWDKPKALEMLARHLGMFKAEDGPKDNTGPGLTVIVQQIVQGGGPAPTAGQVIVNLPPPQ
jgi:phage terminase small subunit